MVPKTVLHPGIEGTGIEGPDGAITTPNLSILTRPDAGVVVAVTVLFPVLFAVTANTSRGR